MIVVLGAVQPRHDFGLAESRKQCCDRHARLTLALKDSIVALSVGLPGRLKSRCTPCIQVQWSKRSRGKPRAVVAGNGRRVAPRRATRARPRDTSLAPKCVASFSATYSRVYASSTVSTRSFCPLARTSLMKFHCPAFVGPCEIHSWLPCHRVATSLGLSPPQIKPLFAVHAVYPGFTFHPSRRSKTRRRYHNGPGPLRSHPAGGEHRLRRPANDVLDTRTCHDECARQARGCDSRYVRCAESTSSRHRAGPTTLPSASFRISLSSVRFRHHLFQRAILLPELTQPSYPRPSSSPRSASPPIEGRLTDRMLAAQLHYRYAASPRRMMCTICSGVNLLVRIAPSPLKFWRSANDALYERTPGGLPARCCRVDAVSPDSLYVARAGSGNLALASRTST
jgi:hypothetical protein